MARYALVIGIGENQPPLRSLTKTVGDAKAIAQVLRDHGGFHVELLTQPQQVQCKALETAIQTFVEQRAAGDEALIYYTGHGFPLARAFGATEAYLAPGDCRVTLEGGRVQAQVNGLSMADLSRLVARANFSNLVMLLDCCHSGSLLEDDLLRQTFADFSRKDYWLMTACRSFEQAYANKSDPHSVFTGAVLAGLEKTRADEQGIITAGSLFEFVQRKLRQEQQEVLQLAVGRPMELLRYPLIRKKVAVNKNIEQNQDLNFEAMIDESPSKIREPVLKGDTKVDVLIVERSIEFPPEYWEAGTSILSYFSRVLSFKYPSKKIKVRIEQEGLRLRMLIDTPTGEREEIEKTLDEYGMVVTGKMQPESLLTDPFEAMALKNKLEIADLELRQTRELLIFTRDNSQQRIESLEVQVNKLHCLIEKGLQSGDYFFGVIKTMAEQDKSTYNLSHAKFGGGFAAEGGFQIGGNLIDLSTTSNLADAAQQIEELLQQLQKQGTSVEDSKQHVASDLAKQAESNPTVMAKLVKWGQSLADTAGKTTVSEVAKDIVKLALQMSGIPLP